MQHKNLIFLFCLLQLTEQDYACIKQSTNIYIHFLHILRSAYEGKYSIEPVIQNVNLIVKRSHKILEFLKSVLK